MVGIDLFENKRRVIFNDEKIVQRFFFNEEIEIAKQFKDKATFYAKVFACKEAVYKLLHNLYPNLFFNKFAIKVSYCNFVFKVEYVLQNDEKINNAIKKINFNKIYISDSDEKDYIVLIAMLSN